MHLSKKRVKNAMQCTRKKFLKNDALLIVLNDDETKDATSLSEEDKDEILVVTKRDIQELKDRQTIY